MTTFPQMTITLTSLERRVSKHPAQSESVKPSTVITLEALLSGFKATTLAKLGLYNKQRPSVRMFSQSTSRGFFICHASSLTSSLMFLRSMFKPITFPMHLGYLIASS